MCPTVPEVQEIQTVELITQKTIVVWELLCNLVFHRTRVEHGRRERYVPVHNVHMYHEYCHYLSNEYSDRDSIRICRCHTLGSDV